MDSNGSFRGIVRGAAHENLLFSWYIAVGDTGYVPGIVGRDPVSYELEWDNFQIPRGKWKSI